MTLVWHLDKHGEPFMDLTPDGSLAAVVDWERAIVYLVKPNGTDRSFEVEEGAVISGIAIKNETVYVLGSYKDYSGVKKYSWWGPVGVEKHGWAGSVADSIARSPSGNHLCYLVTTGATTQELYCDGKKMELNPNDYDLNSVSDSGVVVLARADKAFVFKEGLEMLSFNTSNVIAYRDRLLSSEGEKLRVYSLNGDVLAKREGYTFRMTTLMRWTLIPTGKYIFRYEPLEDTSVLTWNLTELRTLPGFPYFANENFVVTAKDGLIHCYSLEDFHEVFSMKVPGDSLGYVKLSNDGRVLILSDEFGGFWLYKAADSRG
ncbi:hypothetical protein A3K92_04725 [Thermococcus gorgonarius]|uniref:Uncharacterized protein n=2 Tax=Thermococcus gorgonarius TaxID=71997 RepID=A0A2Z2MAV8_THEGO|nr:hypothetical protein A3K92_04725 [Thermococcus gorgonarius]